MSKKVILLIMSNIIIYIPISYSSEGILIPEEFKSMFNSESLLISIQISGTGKDIKIPMIATPFDVKLNVVEQNSLTHYLKSQGVSDIAIKKIIKSLIDGVENDALCSGLVSSCQIIPEYFAFGYDYDSKRLTIFISNSLFENKTTEIIHDSFNENSGLINFIDTNLNFYQNGGSNLIVRDEAILGLPYGNVTTSIYANTDDQMDVEELAYNYEWGRQKFQIGHYKYSLLTNTTGQLDISNGNSIDAISLSSSRNLLRMKNKNYRQLNYFLPGDGIIEVFRDGNKIYKKNVPSGQQSINFIDLPNGNYLAEVVVTSKGKEILREKRKIYNTATFSLKTNDYDYAFIAGKFNLKDSNSSNVLTLDSKAFFDSRLSYQILDNSLLGVRLMTTADNTLSEVSVLKDFGNIASVSAQYSLFDNNTTYLNASLAWSGFSFSYENYLAKNSNYALNNYMLGNSSYKRLTFSRGITLWKGSGYLTYINNKANTNTLLGNKFSDQRDYRSLTAGYSHPFWKNSTVSFSVTWQDNNSGSEWDNSELYSSLLWKIPIGGGGETSSSISFDSEGINEFRNSIKDNINGDNYRVRSEVGVSYSVNNRQKKMSADSSLSGDFRNNDFALDGYAFVKSDGTRSANFSFSSAQVLDGERVYFTSEKSNSYVVFNSDTNGNKDNHLGLLTISENMVLKQSENIDNNQVVIPILEYAQYDINLDTDSSNYITNDEKSTSGYTFPGSILPLSVGLTKVKTFISSFENIKNESIDELHCVGEACVDVEVITDGVFKISVIVGGNYQLTSTTQTCVTPSLDHRTSKIVNIGLNYCLPGIDTEEVQLSLLQPLKIDENIYYFIGVYKSDDELAQSKKNILSIGMEAIEKKVGKRHYLYARTEQDLSISQRDKLEALIQYAMYLFEDDKWVMWR